MIVRNLGMALNKIVRSQNRNGDNDMANVVDESEALTHCPIPIVISNAKNSNFNSTSKFDS